MDFNFSPEDETFRDEFRAWLEKNAPADRESVSEILADGEQGDFQRRVKWFRKLASGGWTCISWPKEYGGRGAGILQNIVYNQELSRIGAPAAMVGMGPTLLGPTLIHWGNEEQKKRYLPKIVQGEEIWCQGYSEPGSGSDLASLQTRAVDEGDYFVVNGQKVWTSIAQFADFIFLLVRTDPNAPKHKGISYLLVDMHSPGITVRPLVQMTGGRGFNEVFFEDVRVPKKNLVGEKNQGWQVAITTLMFERSGGAGNDRGASGMIEDLVELAKKIPRNGKSAWESADVRQKIAEFACEATAIKYTGLRQLTKRLKGLPPGPEGSMLKLCSTELNLKVSLYAMELLGPYSQFEYNADHSVDRGRWSYRMLSARGPTIFAGTNQIQHNIIGERVLGLPKG
jgi:alkylation response protein AidB-like acyl-CoA dehydrogenase